MVLMRRLLLEAQAKFRKMMSDNKALASRIDHDIQSAHLQVSALRAELADTNQRIRDICLQSTESSSSMAGNVITTCMPPTSTTNTTAVNSTADGDRQWSKEAAAAKQQEQSVLRADSSSSATSVCLRTMSSSPPIADKGGTKQLSLDRSNRDATTTDQPRCQQSSKLIQRFKGGDEKKASVVNGSPQKETEMATSVDKVDKIQTVVHDSPQSKVALEKEKSEQSPTNKSSAESALQSKSLHTSPQSKKDVRDNNKPDSSLTESSEASEETSSVSKHRNYRRERRSLKGSDVQKSLLNELKSQQQLSDNLDDSKSELQRSESDGNQNSAPECDLSLSGSPFKEDTSSTKLDIEKSVLAGSSSVNNKSIVQENTKDSKKEDYNIDFHRNSPPVKDDSNAQCFNFLKDTSACSKNFNSEGHQRYKSKTKSDPLDKRRDPDKCSQEYSVLSSPNSVMKYKPGVSKLQLGICSWEERRFDRVDTSSSGSPWYKTQDTSSSVSDKSLPDEFSSKDETSDSRDGLPSEFCDHSGTTKEDNSEGGRYVIFDSKRSQQHRPQWRTSLSESYRDQIISKPWKGTDNKEKITAKFEDKREIPEKDDPSANSLVAQESSYYRKSLNVDYPYNGATKDQEQSGSSSIHQLSAEVEALRIRNAALLRDLEEVMESRDEKAKENAAMAARLEQTEKELKHAKEALVALKQDRKRLKAEKFDLLTQMKQLYSTLEDKEEELREFIRNYEQKMKESEENMKQMVKDREEMEQEKWTILKRARDESERAVLLCTQIGLKDAHIKELQEELTMMQEKQMVSSNDIRQTNGFGSPGSMSYRTANGIDSRGTPTPTPGSDPTTSPSYAGTPTITAQYQPNTSPQKMISGPALLSPEHHRPSLLSRSAEDIFNPMLGCSSSVTKKKAKEKKGTWGSISRVFSRSRRRKPLDPELFESNRSSWSPKESVCSSPLSEESYVQKLRLLEETHGTPMQHWRAATVLAWLEITMDMPQYGARCAENIKSGKVLLELSESELEEGLGITNVMHRRKLRLAIEEHRQPSLCRYPKICLMTHSWVVEEWLPSIGLMCYLPSFSEHLVDGRVLDTLTKKDLEKHFGITRKFHQLSILHGIQLLRMLNFDRQILNQRRMNSENMDVDPLVWTNQRLIKWAASIDLGEYAENLRNTGVHGALAVLEPSFTADTIATALGIPTSKNIIRRHLTTEWQNLIQPARLSLESESVVAKKSKSEKRLASGSSSISLVSQGRSSSSIMPSYARRTLDRYDRRRSSWRFSTWRSSQESLKSTSKKTPPIPTATATVERPQLLPLSPKLNTSRHRRTFSSHSDVETLTVTPV